MPACGQCGRDNPEGTAFCGYCGYPLAKPAGKPSSSQLKPGVNPVSLPSAKPPPPPPAPPPKMLRKPEVRMQTFATPPPADEGKSKGGFEWIPWSELSPGQRAGRSVAVVVAVLVILFFLRGMLRGVVGGGTAGTAPRTECERSDRRRSQRRHRVVVQGISDLRLAQERQGCGRSREQRGGVVQTERQSVARTQRIHPERSSGRVPRRQTGSTRLRRGGISAALDNKQPPKMQLRTRTRATGSNS